MYHLSLGDRCKNFKAKHLLNSMLSSNLALPKLWQTLLNLAIYIRFVSMACEIIGLIKDVYGRVRFPVIEAHMLRDESGEIVSHEIRVSGQK